jgi:hypothetical protein
MSTAASTSPARSAGRMNDPPIEPDDPYGPGKSVTGHDGEEAIDD